MSADPEGAALEAAAARLDEIARRIGEGDLPAEEVRALGDEALRLSGEITERLGRVLRAAEAD
ncbi:MAG: hypothetical protein AB7V42_04140 [Thermoleophilia bacterium]